MQPTYITLSEVARRLGVSVSKARKIVADWPYATFGKTRRYLADAVGHYQRRAAAAASNGFGKDKE